MKSMVLGFAFSADRKQVLLIEKKRPKWQAGYFNGIGGHVEDGETPLEAMYREGCEEANLDRVGVFEDGDGWEHSMTFTCKGGTVFVFRSFLSDDELHQTQTMTDEDIHAVSVKCLPAFTLDNLRWMIPMLLDNLQFPVLLSYNSRGGCRQEAIDQDEAKKAD